MAMFKGLHFTFSKVTFAFWLVFSGLAVFGVGVLTGDPRMMAATAFGCIVGSFRMEEAR